LSVRYSSTASRGSAILLRARIKILAGPDEPCGDASLRIEKRRCPELRRPVRTPIRPARRTKAALTEKISINVQYRGGDSESKRWKGGYISL
jgi:hypothetical protein